MKIRILKQLTLKQQLTPALLLMTLPLLSGCSIMGVYEGSFDCPAGKGVGCKSISDVNDMVNQGILPPAASPDDPQDNPEDYPEGNSAYSENELNSSCGNTYQHQPEAEPSNSYDNSSQHPYDSNDDSLNHFTDRSPNNFEHRHGAQEPCGRCAVRTSSSWQDEIWWSDALEEDPIPLWVEDEVGA